MGPGQVTHTYFAYARGIEDWIGTLMILDRAPLGRNEESGMDWVRRHDEYAETPEDGCGGEPAHRADWPIRCRARPM